MYGVFVDYSPRLTDKQSRKRFSTRPYICTCLTTPTSASLTRRCSSARIALGYPLLGAVSYLSVSLLLIQEYSGQRWSSGPCSEQIYLHFGDTDASSTWLVLLRSYARAEIYGHHSDGGLYRMWRQVELTVMQGRNLGNPKPFVDTSASSSIPCEDPKTESGPVDLDVFCEIRINDNICGRTTVIKGIGSPDWHENFVFADLPPFEALDVLLWKEKRLVKSTLLGSIRIALTNFRRNEDVEGWFPVIQSGGILTGIQVGEIRMKLKVHE